MQKEKLFGKNLNELIAVTKRIGLPGFAAKQISDWLYKKEITTIEEMTNLSKKTRDLLSVDYEIGLYPPERGSESSDGTKKYLYKVLKNKFIETAYIPDNERATICVSSQSGCKMGCLFCMTGNRVFREIFQLTKFSTSSEACLSSDLSPIWYIWAWGNLWIIFLR